MLDFKDYTSKETLTATFTLFAVIDILGTIPVLISLKEKMGGTIRTLQATIASAVLMITFYLSGGSF